MTDSDRLHNLMFLHRKLNPEMEVTRETLLKTTPLWKLSTSISGYNRAIKWYILEIKKKEEYETTKNTKTRCASSDKPTKSYVHPSISFPKSSWPCNKNSSWKDYCQRIDGPSE